MKKTIALISPHYPPFKGGVADYTFKLAQTLRKQEVKTTVITGEKSNEENVFTVELPLRPYDIKSILQKHDISDVIIQYTPRPFHPKTNGVGLSLIKTILCLRKNFNVHLYTHESHFPINLSLAGLILGPCHFFQYFIIASLCKKVMFSTAYFKEYWQRFLFFKKSDLKEIPIGSNLLPNNKDNENFKVQKQIVFFASNHPTCLKDCARKIIHLIHKKFPNYRFVILGVKKHDFELGLDDSIVSYPGHLSEEEISKVFAQSMASLNPYYDGCSSRRGTLLASLAHGIPAFTNLGFSSGQTIAWREFCLIPPSGDAKDLPQFVCECLTNIELLAKQRIAIHEHYEKTFSWQTIGHSILTHID